MSDSLPIDEILRAAAEAGAEIMTLYKRADKFQVYEKQDQTPVTDADLAANRVLAEELPRLVEIPLLSEEISVSTREVTGWERFWVIDPLDGTKGFIKGSDDFAINIAIVEGGRAVFGMIYLPVTKQAFYGARGAGTDGGAFQRDEADEQWREIRVNSPAEDNCRVIGSSHSKNPAMQRIAGKIAGASMANIGSAIKFALIANGAATVYPRFGPTSWWDTAAGQCIVEEAGGKVLDAELKPLTYDNPASFVNPNFIAYAYDDPRWCEPWLEAGREAK